nr:M35 family metallo-endopeptidase [Massilia genomosp. 1]
MASQGASYFAAGNADLRYKTWFGNYDASRYALGKAHFTSIQDAFVNQPVNVNCTCNPASGDPNSIYAYVYPSQPYNIYVGD